MIRPPVVDADERDVGSRVRFLDARRDVAERRVGSVADVRVKPEVGPGEVLHPAQEVLQVIVDSVVGWPSDKCLVS